MHMRTVSSFGHRNRGDGMRESVSECLSLSWCFATTENILDNIPASGSAGRVAKKAKNVSHRAQDICLRAARGEIFGSLYGPHDVLILVLSELVLFATTRGSGLKMKPDKRVDALASRLIRRKIISMSSCRRGYGLMEEREQGCPREGAASTLSDQILQHLAKDTPREMRRRRAHHAVLDRFEVEERGRVTGAGPAQRAEPFLAVLHVQALLAHRGQLAALRHEHHQEDGGRGGDEPEREARVPMAIGHGQPAQRPAEPDRYDATDGEPDVGGLPVVVPDAARLDRQDGDEHDQKHDVDER
uniref:Uncharacterized protein n=1 Tax=Anopheles farauti TaxID=69004 RepID=A0A182QEU5_9DIPT